MIHAIIMSLYAHNIIVDPSKIMDSYPGASTLYNSNIGIQLSGVIM